MLNPAIQHPTLLCSAQPCHVHAPSPAEPKFFPEWRLLEANDWKKRSLALQRFTQAVNKEVYRQRMLRRLAKIKEFLAQVRREGC